LEPLAPRRPAADRDRRPAVPAFPTLDRRRARVLPEPRPAPRLAVPVGAVRARAAGPAAARAGGPSRRPPRPERRSARLDGLAPLAAAALDRPDRSPARDRRPPRAAVRLRRRQHRQRLLARASGQARLDDW